MRNLSFPSLVFASRQSSRTADLKFPRLLQRSRVPYHEWMRPRAHPWKSRKLLTAGLGAASITLSGCRLPGKFACTDCEPFQQPDGGPETVEAVDGGLAGDAGTAEDADSGEPDASSTLIPGLVPNLPEDGGSDAG
jgi:hypothetical protein